MSSTPCQQAMQAQNPNRLQIVKLVCRLSACAHMLRQMLVFGDRKSYFERMEELGKQMAHVGTAASYWYTQPRFPVGSETEVSHRPPMITCKER